MRIWNLRLNSLQTRLLAGAILWICVGLLSSGWAISHMLRDHVTGQFHHELEDHLTELRGLTSLGADHRLSLLRPVSDPRFAYPGSGYYWEIWKDGQPVLRSESLAGGDIGPGKPPGLDVARTKTRIDPGTPPFDFAVAGDTSELTSVMQRFQHVLTLSLGAIALGLCTAAVAQVAFGLRPLRRLRLALNDVRDGRTTALPVNFPQEVLPLVNDVNALLAAQADLIRRARSQAGNLGHALRTPLAILGAEARTLAAQGNTEAAETILAECRTMTRQVDFQVARARSAASRSGAGARTAVRAEVQEIIAAMEKLWAQRAIIFRNDVPRDLKVTVDADDLKEILGNLIDNAAKWASHQVNIGAAQSGDTIFLTVADDGPGVPPDKWDAIFALGERLDESKAGSGLGLAIVKDLVGLYEGDISLGQSELGGLIVTISLPKPR